MADKVILARRTFGALEYPKGSPSRMLLNENALTSEYYTSHKWIVLEPFLMSDGTPHPTQKNFASTFKIKKDAIAYLEKKHITDYVEVKHA